MDNKYDAVMQRLQYWRTPEYIPIAEDDVLQFERQLGYSLPADYRTFLVKYGLTAGEPDTLYPNANDPDGSEGSVEVFFGLNPAAYRDLRNIREVLLHRECGHLPERLLPIASAPGGKICISLFGSDRGTVYWWEQNGDNELIYIAADFDRFMNSLRHSRG